MNYPSGYWTLDRILAEARKFKNLKDFRKDAHKAYDAARSKGFLPEVKKILIESTKPKGYWTTERITEEAKQYKYKSDFHKGCPTGYSIAHKKGFLDSICSHMTKKKQNHKWTYKTAKDVALKYNSRKELRENEGFCYAKILQEGWTELLSHMHLKSKPMNYWTDEKVIEVAKKYKTVKEFRDAEPGAYDAAHENNLMEIIWVDKEVVGHKYKRALYVWEFEDNSAYIGLTFNYTKRYRDHKKQGPVNEKLKSVNGKFIKLDEWFSAKEARVQEGKLIRKYRDAGWTILNSAKAGSLGGGSRSWTIEKVLEIAKKYESLKDFRSNENGAYIAMQTYHWEDEINQLYGRVAKRNWTYDEVIAEAKKAKSYSDFIKSHNKAYVFALRKKWLKEIKALFPSTNPINEINKIASKGKLVLLSVEYKNNTSDLIFQCNKSHLFTRSAAVLKRTIECPICIGNKSQEFYKKRINKIKTAANKS